MSQVPPKQDVPFTADALVFSLWIISDMDALRLLMEVLTPREKASVRRVLILAAGVGLLEVLAVFSVFPFMAIASDPGSYVSHPIVQRLGGIVDLTNSRSLLLLSGAVVLGLVVAANLAATLSLRLVNLTAGNVVHYLSCRLLRSYVKRPYEWFLSRHSSGLNRNLLDEVQRAVLWALLPLLYSGVRGIGALFLVLLLLMFDPVLTLVAGGILSIAYLAIYFGVRAIQDRLGASRVQAAQNRYFVATEVLGGIKEVKSLGAEEEFLRRFESTGPSYVRSNSWSRVVSEAPRHVVEVLAIGTVLSILLVLLFSGDTLSGAAPTLALFAFASYKMVPSFHQVFSGVTTARFQVPALRDLVDDLTGAEGEEASVVSVPAPIRMETSLEMVGVTFCFDGSTRPALSGVSFQVMRGERIGLVGPTGAGKTTLADVLLGLLHPHKGTLLLDGSPVTGEDWIRWRASVGYVPQSIFLSDDSLKANIAFGVPLSDMDLARIREVADLAELNSLVERLPSGFDTRVGERGARLSGGQRQRVGIARALYRDPTLLLLDEATSALDGITEEAVMDSVFGLGRNRTTLIIAHRLATVRRCDRIILLEDGVISAQGTWEELMKESDLFQLLVRREAHAELGMQSRGGEGEGET